jgi:hypothetical protein
VVKNISEGVVEQKDDRWVWSRILMDRLRGVWSVEKVGVVEGVWPVENEWV